MLNLSEVSFSDGLIGDSGVVVGDVFELISFFVLLCLDQMIELDDVADEVSVGVFSNPSELGGLLEVLVIWKRGSVKS